MRAAQSKNRNDMYKLFLFAANNSRSEWAIAHAKGVNERYSIGAFMDPDISPTKSPSFSDLGLRPNEVASHLHSHPNIHGGILAERESMGAWESGPHGDWGHEIDRYYDSGGRSPYYSAVYFPGSTRLYNVQAAKGPVFIRNIGNNYNRLFYGGL